ncbi:site-specific integrase [Thiothrix lacustris]|uniref:site-specific integrase n=1 Tax=Thiothrix lacustris TaxID=525917 RepID=UPI000490DD8B|nr:site-specific integrase [Thiothrix lacustris]
MSTLTTTSNTNLTIGEVGAQAKQFIIESTSEATRKAYRSDLTIFVSWCDSRSLEAMPASPATIADFLASQANDGISPSTLNRRVSAVRFAHETAGMNSPTTDKLVSATLKGIKRNVGAKVEKKSAATVDKIYSMIAQCDTKTIQGKRDKAILLLGFAGAFRRSELAGLELSDIEFVTDGARITIRKSKTDQEAQGQTIAIYNGKLNVCGILKDYLQAAGIVDGALFRPITKSDKTRNQAITDKSIATIVKRYAEAAGLNPDDFSGHSLRSGFITSASESGANLFKIMDVSRHKSVQTVRGYVRNAEMFKDHAGSSFL